MLATIRYVASEIVDNYDDKRWWKQRITHRVNGGVQSYYPGYDDAVAVMDEDWDNFVVLDACRPDLFKEIVDVDRFDSYQEKTSLGSATPEWLKRNFQGEYGDTVYVSANPQVTKHANGKFHRLIEVWKDEFTDDDRKVMPDPVTDAAIEASQEYPDKRLIVHYMQPHVPFVTTDQLYYGGMYTPEKVIEGDPEFTEYQNARNVWEALEMGIVEYDELWKYYRENLEVAMESVWRLLDEVDGRTVVTSDHGNSVGERGWPIPLKTYGHPTGIRSKELVTVPWAVVEGERRQITDGETERTAVDKDEIENRLQDLGYK